MFWQLAVILSMLGFVAVGLLMIIGTFTGVPFLVDPKKSPLFPMFQGAQPERTVFCYNMVVGITFIAIGTGVMIWALRT